MRISTTDTSKLRPLHIKFDHYNTESDPDFRRELVTLMAGSLSELRHVAAESMAVPKTEIFRKAVHKAKSTISLLNDDELNRTIERFHQALTATEQSGGLISSSEELTALSMICESYIESLTHEAASIRQRLVK
jgi:hypothetical protein